MILRARYGIGPYYNTPHLFNEVRQVYTHRGYTVHVDHEQVSKHTEIFTFTPTGPIWFVAEFKSEDWADAKRKAQRAVNKWIEEMDQ